MSAWSWVNDLPLRAIHDVIIGTRYQYPVAIPATTGFVVDKPVDEIEDAFADAGWEDGTLPSYRYEGEVLNLRRPAGRIGVAHPKYGGTLWMQDHCRVFELRDGRHWSLCHHEPSPLPHPGAHYHEKGFSWKRGTNHLREQLEALGWAYEVEWNLGDKVVRA